MNLITRELAARGYSLERQHQARKDFASSRNFPVSGVIRPEFVGVTPEVFVGDPPGSIWERQLFPHLPDPGFLLLRPEHIDQMLLSFNEHCAEVTVMEEKAIALLTQWRDRCSNDNSTMVAYFLDY